MSTEPLIFSAHVSNQSKDQDDQAFAITSQEALEKRKASGNLLNVAVNIKDKGNYDEWADKITIDNGKVLVNFATEENAFSSEAVQIGTVEKSSGDFITFKTNRYIDLNHDNVPDEWLGIHKTNDGWNAVFFVDADHNYDPQLTQALQKEPEVTENTHFVLDSMKVYTYDINNDAVPDTIKSMTETMPGNTLDYVEANIQLQTISIASETPPNTTTASASLNQDN